MYLLKLLSHLGDYELRRAGCSDQDAPADDAQGRREFRLWCFVNPTSKDLLDPGAIQAQVHEEQRNLGPDRISGITHRSQERAQMRLSWRRSWGNKHEPDSSGAPAHILLQ